MQRIETGKFDGAAQSERGWEPTVEMRERDYRLLIRIARAAEHLRNCNYNDQHVSNPIGRLNDALDAFNKSRPAKSGGRSAVNPLPARKRK
jgi:hypothetical protein